MIRAESISWNVDRGLVAPEWQWAWDGLVLAAPIVEGGGSLYDVVGRRQSTLVNGPTWGVMTNERFQGRAIDLELDSSQYHFFDDTPDWDDLESLTVLVWIKAESVSGEQRILNKWDGSDGWILRKESSANWSFLIDTSGGITGLTTSFGVDTNVHQLVGTYDHTQTTNNHKIFVDGVRRNIGNKSGGVVTDGATTLRIGAGESANSPFDGLVGHLMIWNKPQPESRIWDLYLDPDGWRRMDPRLFGKVAAAVAGVPGGAYYQQYHTHVIAA